MLSGPTYYFVENLCTKCFKVIKGSSQISEECAKNDFQDTYLLHLQAHGLSYDEAQFIVSRTIMKPDSCDSEVAKAKP